jgi:hypothetical protein
MKSNCRNCFDPPHMGGCTIATIGYDSEGIANEESCCPCNEYIPLDNLEYLEWMDEKRSN